MKRAAPPVAIVTETGAAPTALLARAALAIGLEARARRAFARKGAGGLAVVVPALGGFAAGSPAMADPALVEGLIDLLRDWGAREVVVASTEGSDALWLENRDVAVRADLLGYRYVTDKGRDYDIVDLADDAAVSPFASDSVLAGVPLSDVWQDAALRVVVAACRTDRADGYALSLDTLLSVLPGRDKDGLYRRDRPPAAVIGALLAATPVDAVFIDAVVSSHGEAGAARPEALATGTVIAATDPWSADAAGALMMGLDPAVSPLWRPEGTLTGAFAGVPARFENWINVPAQARLAAARWRQDRGVDQTLSPIVQEVDTALFPYRNEINARAQAIVLPVLRDRAGGRAAALVLDGLAACAAETRAAYRIMAGKDAVARIAAPLDVRADSLGEEDWSGLLALVAGQRALLRGTSADAEGLRWRMAGGAVLFDCLRRYPVPFDAFVAGVPIHRTIQFMNDYIGGEAITVARDADGRTTRQLERNLYLPQPNFTALLGGEVIDVTKIETVDYAPGRQLMAWRTLSSANGSALADDGLVEFAQVGGDTVVTIFARQHFRQPPLVEAMRLDLWPELHAWLVRDAYHRFARRTFANLEAVLEGRDVRIGYAAAGLEEAVALPADRLLALAERLRDELPEDWLGAAKGWLSGRARDEAVPSRIDPDGLRHFAAPARLAAGPHAPGPSSAFARLGSDLRKALAADMGLAR